MRLTIGADGEMELDHVERQGNSSHVIVNLPRNWLLARLERSRGYGCGVV